MVKAGVVIMIKAVIPALTYILALVSVDHRVAGQVTTSDQQTTVAVAEAARAVRAELGVKTSLQDAKRTARVTVHVKVASTAVAAVDRGRRVAAETVDAVQYA